MIETRGSSPSTSLPFQVSAVNDQQSVEERMKYAPPAVEQLNDWCASNRELVEERLLQHGAILFRGFSVRTEDQLARFAAAQAPAGLLSYTDGTSPRTKLSAGVYTSTEYPADQFISLHNELSYSHRWPSRLFFACHTPARQGGETPIADSRRILQGLRPETRGQFISKNVKYIRYLHGGDGLGLSWQQTFETADRAAVRRFCEQGGVEYEWNARGGLRLSHTRPAVTCHPVTGETVWFNQADQFHPTEMSDDTRRLLQGAVEESEWPKNVRFGDDSPIGTDLLDEIRQVTRRETVNFPWRRGDVLMIDNVLVSHGRNPFVGSRRILVAMA